MTNKLILSEEEEKALFPILSSMSSRTHYQVTLLDLLAKWARFVTSVEGIYNESVYEYTNDLSVRDLLEEITINCTGNLRQKILMEVKVFDNRFFAATASSPRSVLKGESPQWWWFRIPIQPGDELKKDLQFEGLIE